MFAAAGSFLAWRLGSRSARPSDWRVSWAKHLDDCRRLELDPWHRLRKVRVNSYVERDLDLRRYHTYAWAPPDAFTTGDPWLDNNTFFSERVQQAVDGHLHHKGFEKVGGGEPDFIVHYHARVEQRLDSTELCPDEPRCRTGDCRPFVYDAGTLLVDVVDRRSNQLLWRGWAERGLQGVVDNQSWMDQTVDDAVRRIMERFPS